ncbi:hypothetical protein ACLK19_08275 [Escherichia coli]
MKTASGCRDGNMHPKPAAGVAASGHFLSLSLPPVNIWQPELEDVIQSTHERL